MKKLSVVEAIQRMFPPTPVMATDTKNVPVVEAKKLSVVEAIQRMFPPVMAQDDQWITVKPRGKSKTGSPVLLGPGGEIKAGMGGKFTGKKIESVTKSAPKAEGKGKVEKKETIKSAPASKPVVVPEKPEWQKNEEAAQQRVRDLGDRMQEAMAKGDYEEFEKILKEGEEARRAYAEAFEVAQEKREVQREVDLANADVEKINASISKVEAKNRKLKYEKMTVVDLNGNVVASVRGETYSVKTPAGMSLKDKTVTHNHPSYTTFSPADVDAFGSEKNREMRATTLDGKTYSILRTGKDLGPGFGQSAKKALESFVDEALIVAEKGLTIKEREGIFDKEYNKLCYEWFKKNEEKYGYKYTVS